MHKKEVNKTDQSLLQAVKRKKAQIKSRQSASRELIKAHNPKSLEDAVRIFADRAK